jgi:hypothetical protein
MTQILWNSNAPHSRIDNHEMIELRLVDLGRSRKLRYLVREIRASWSAALQQIEWKGFEDEAYSTCQEAQRGFESRKASRIGAGFGSTTVLN